MRVEKSEFNVYRPIIIILETPAELEDMKHLMDTLPDRTLDSRIKTHEMIQDGGSRLRKFHKDMCTRLRDMEMKSMTYD